MLLGGVNHPLTYLGGIGYQLLFPAWAYLLGRLLTAAAVIDATMWLRHREVDPGQDGVHSTPEGNP
jgi:predicted outer membrane lipoprotein